MTYLFGVSRYWVFAFKSDLLIGLRPSAFIMYTSKFQLIVYWVKKVCVLNVVWPVIAYWIFVALEVFRHLYKHLRQCFCILGIVGEADENGEDYFLWTYKKLEIGYNGNRIVDVNLTSEGKVKLVPNTRIAMSYSVSKLLNWLTYSYLSWCVN